MEPNPATAPCGRTTVAFTLANQRTRHRVYAYGDHDDVINPGDLLIVTAVADILETRTYIHGHDMSRFARVATEAAALYEENADWLSAPATTVRGAA